MPATAISHEMCVLQQNAKPESITLKPDVRDVQHEQNSSAKTGVGTPIYMAPEIIYGGNRYDAKVGPSES